MNRNHVSLLGLAALTIVCFPLVTQAQKSVSISGRVVDAASLKPVPFASVFIDRTTFGVSTDSSGHFRLIVPGNYLSLGASSIGYETKTIDLVPDQDRNFAVEIRLVAKPKLLQEVVVSGSSEFKRRRRLFLERFRKELIGDTRNAESCRILNPDALSFRESHDTIYVTSRGPISIINDALGYLVKIDLSVCKLTYHGYEFRFMAHFYPAKPTSAMEDGRWQINRAITYDGSQEQFFKSLVENKYEKRGYEIYRLTTTIVPGSKGIHVSYVKDNTPLRREEMLGQDVAGRYFVKRGLYEIHFLKKSEGHRNRIYPDLPYPVSRIEIVDSSLYVNPDGSVQPSSVSWGSPAKYIRLPGTYFDRMRLADLLPEDYDNRGEEINLADGPFEANISGVATDHEKKPVRNAQVFLNGTTFKTLSDSTGRFRINNVPAGTYDLVIHSWNKQDYLGKITADPQRREDVSIELPSRNLTPWNQVDEKDREVYEASFSSKFHHLKLLNPSALEFKEESGDVHVRARLPLIFENRKMGYKVKFFFDSTQAKISLWPDFSVNGFTLYDTLGASSDREKALWERNRFEYYQGSELQFFHSLAEGRATDEGFRIYAMDYPSITPANFLNPKDIKHFTSSFRKMARRNARNRNGKSLIIAPDSLLTLDQNHNTFAVQIKPLTGVAYFSNDRHMDDLTRAQWSWLYPLNSPLKITRSGMLPSRMDLGLMGTMNEGKIPLLPINYEPLNRETYSTFLKPAVSAGDVLAFLEKPFIQTDKSCYYPGEKIWFSSIMRYENQELKDLLSSVLYVELINPDKEIIQSQILPVKDQVSWGDFRLPESLKTGLYHLRAYTAWSSNFGDKFIFNKPLLVLNPLQNVDQRLAKVKPTVLGDIHVKLQTDKGSYKVREKIEAAIQLTDKQGNPVEGHFSASVTDSSEVARIGEFKTILDEDPYGKIDSGFIRLNSPVEKEISYFGLVRSPFGKQKAASVFIFDRNEKYSQIVNTNQRGYFDFTVKHEDTLLYYLGLPTESTSYPVKTISVFRKTPIPPIDFSNPAMNIPLKRENMQEQITHSRRDSTNAILLKEVVVTEQIDNRPAWIRKIPPTMTFSAPSQLAALQAAPSLLEGLTRIIPGLTVTTRGPEGISFLSSPGAMGVNLYLNGYSIINSMPANLVASLATPSSVVRVEYRKRYSALQFNGLSDAIFIFTAGGYDSYTSNYNKVTLKGFSRPSKFWSPDYSKTDSTQPDLRTTLYWNPSLSAGSSGISEFSFYSADRPTTYRVTISGISKQGIPIWGEGFIKVM